MLRCLKTQLLQMFEPTDASSSRCMFCRCVVKVNQPVQEAMCCSEEQESLLSRNLVSLHHTLEYYYYKRHSEALEKVKSLGAVEVFHFHFRADLILSHHRPRRTGHDPCD